MQQGQPPSRDADCPVRFHFDVIDSTNARARELTATHPGRTLLVSADEQTAGRGRNGRTWSSPRGGAWFTVAVPMLGDAVRYTPAPLAAGLAVIAQLADVLSGDAVAELEIKWPNDVLLNGAKVCGILCEQALGDGTAHVVPSLMVGVGINVNLTPDDLPSDVRYPATTLQAVAGRPLSVPQIIKACGQAITREMTRLQSDGLSDEQYRRLQAALAWRGQRVSVSGASGLPHAGTLHGIDRQGRVMVKLADTGEVMPFDIGDLHLRRSADR